MKVTDVDEPVSGQDTNTPELRVKGPWKKEEDDTVRQLVDEHGPKKWSFIASFLTASVEPNGRKSLVSFQAAQIMRLRTAGTKPSSAGTPPSYSFLLISARVWSC